MVGHQVESRWLGLNSYLRDFVSQIDMPGCSSLSSSPGAQLIRKQRSKARFPITHRFMSELKASFQKHLGYMLPSSACGNVIESEGEKWKIEGRNKR